MQSYTRCLLAAAVLLAAASLLAQEVYRSDDPDLLARLSYDRSSMPRVGLDDVRGMCIAVSRSGTYRIERMTGTQIQRLEGRMPREQFKQLKTLLKSPEFRVLLGNDTGLIRQEAEIFRAEISLGLREHADGAGRWIEQDAWRMQWLDADGESPFPGSVVKVIEWLRNFEPEGGKRFEYAEYPDVCPSGGLHLLQPTAAANGRP